MSANNMPQASSNTNHQRSRFARGAALFCLAALMASLSGGQPALQAAQDADQDNAPAATKTVSGVVVDAQWQPVAGAEVFLFRSGIDTELSIQATTDEQGRYSKEFTVPAGSSLPSRYWYGLVRHAERGMAVDSTYDGWGINVSDHYELSFILGDTRPLEVKVTDPDGAALANVDVRWSGMSSLTGEGLPLSEATRKLEARKTDADGIARWDQCPQVSALSLLVEAPGYALQFVSFSGKSLTSGSQLSLELRPVGRLRGKITAADPAAVRNLEVSANSGGARSTTRTNENGEFDIVDLPAGSGSVGVSINPEFPFVIGDRPKFELAAGETVDVTLNLVPGVIASGRVVDEVTEEPVAGVTVNGNYLSSETDENGEYEVVLVPDSRLGVRINSYLLPSNYVQQFDYWHNIAEVPESGSVEVPTFYITPGVIAHGIVVDEDGNPVSGATVRADWTARKGTGSTHGQVETTSNAQGEFTLTALQAGQPIDFLAYTSELGMNEPLTTTVDPEKPITLQLATSGTGKISGIVVDQDNNPVPGAQIQFRREMRSSTTSFSYGYRDFLVGGFRWIVTDANGRFETPVKVPRALRYQVILQAEHMLKREISLDDALAKSHNPPAVNAADNPTDDRIVVPPLVMQRVMEVRGIVLDKAGTPLPGVKVWAHGAKGVGDDITAVTQADGAFHLTALHPKANFVFAEHENYRMTGGLLPKSGELTLIMSARSDPPDEPMRLITRTKEQRAKNLLRLLEPILDKLATHRSSQPLARAVHDISEVDPERAIQLLPRVKYELTRIDTLVELGAAEDAIDAAIAIEDPYRRVFAIRKTLEIAGDQQTKLRLLNEALHAARSIERVDNRVLSISNVAEAAYDVGERELAKEILNTAFATAKALPDEERAGFSRGWFAEKVALFDIDAAEELISGIGKGDNFESARHVGNIAHELAAINPELAESFLKRITADYELSRYGARVCYRMAPVDFDRALRIAEGLPRRGSPTEALGVMAVALYESGDTEGAKSCLAMAYDRLSGVWRAEQGIFGQTIALAGYADMIDPENSREYFWMALANHGGPESGRSFGNRGDDMNHDAHLAMYLGLYGAFSEIQGKLLEPIFQYWESYASLDDEDRPLRTYDQPDTVTAMALYDVERTLGWHKTFHAGLSDEEMRFLPQIWESLSDAVRLDTQELCRTISSEVFHLWRIDEEDL